MRARPAQDPAAAREDGVENLGIFNREHGAEAFGFRELSKIHWNFEAPRLYEEAMQRREAVLAQGGALVAETGVHTGRSPKDKFIVNDAATADAVWWDNNGAMSPQQFDLLLQDFLDHARGKELFAQDLYGGADQVLHIEILVRGMGVEIGQQHLELGR
jgi:phosphoenolpyruvate carboxykinase (ATP)